VNEDKDNQFVEQLIRTNTWWKLKTMVDEKLLGKKREYCNEQNWETDA